MADGSPGDTGPTALIGELLTRSEEFRTAWATHNVRPHHTGRKAFRHPAVGEMTLDFDARELPAQPGPTLTAEPAAPAQTRCNCWPRGRPPRTRPLPSAAAEQRGCLWVMAVDECPS